MTFIKRLSVAALCAAVVVSITQCNPKKDDKDAAAERASKLAANATKACTTRDITVGGVAEKGLCETAGNIPCTFTTDGKCEDKVSSDCLDKDKAGCIAVPGNKCVYEDAPIDKCFDKLPDTTATCAAFGERKSQCITAKENDLPCYFDEAAAAKSCKAYANCAAITLPADCQKATGKCQLQADNKTCEDVPPATAINTVKEVALNAKNTCLINDKDNVVCFPAMTTNDATNAAAPADAIKVKSITAGDDHFCAQVIADGKPHCWGKNTAFADLPDAKVTQVAAGTTFTCWIKDADSKVECKGVDAPKINEHGTSKDGSNEQDFKDFTWSSISVGDEHVCGVLKADVATFDTNVTPKTGDIFCFGASADKVSNPILVAAKATELALTKTHTAYLADGTPTIQPAVTDFLTKFVEQGTNAADKPIAKDEFANLYSSATSAKVCGIKTNKVYCSTGDLTGFVPAKPTSVAVGGSDGICAITDKKLACKGAAVEVPADYAVPAV